MRIFLHLFALDMRKGFVSMSRRLLLCFLIVVALVLIESSAAQTYYVVTDNEIGLSSPISLGESFVSLFCSHVWYEPTSETPFILPYEWMLVMLMPAYLLLDYPLDDLRDTGQNTISLCGRRALWWASKCCWVVMGVVLFFILTGLAAALATLCAGGYLSLDVRPEFLQYLLFYPTIEAPWDIAVFVLMCFVSVCALCLIQLCVQLYIGTMPSFACTIALLFVSAYFDQAILLGEYAMASRSGIFFGDGYNPAVGMVLALTLSVWAIAGSALLFQKKDILPRSDS